MKYYICCLTEEEVKMIESSTRQYNLEYGYDDNRLESLPTVRITKEQYEKFFNGTLI